MQARTVILAASALLFAATVSGQQILADSTATSLPDSTICIVDHVNNSGNIRVCGPEALRLRLTRTVHPGGALSDASASDVAATTVVATRNGYRVQVFDDNSPGTARAQAEAKRVQFENAFPQWRAYVTFNSPYWQVRVGDFRRRGEAEAALAQIRDGMPSVSAYARIVSEKINITE